MHEVGTDPDKILILNTEIQAHTKVTVDASTDYLWPVSDEAIQTDHKSFISREAQTLAMEIEPLEESKV